MVVGVSCLIGFVVGLALRPYIRIFHVSLFLCNLCDIFKEFRFMGKKMMIFHKLSEIWELCRQKGKRVHRCNETWKHCLISLGKQVRTHFCAIRSVVADYYLVRSLLRLFWLCHSHLFLLFLFGTDYRVVPRVSSSESVSLLDANSVSSGSEITEITKSSKYDDQLKDLMSFDGSLELCYQKLEQKGEEENGERGFNGIIRIEEMIKTNVLHFKQAAKDRIIVDGSLLASSGLVKRR